MTDAASTLLAVAGTVAGVWFLRWGMERPSISTGSQAAVFGAIKALLLRGVDGAWLHFQLKHDASKVVVFTKYVRSFGDIGFRGALAADAVDAGQMERLRSALRAKGISFDDAGGVAIDFGRDVGLAHLFVRLVFETAFGASLERDGIAYNHAVLVFNMRNKTGSD